MVKDSLFSVINSILNEDSVTVKKGDTVTKLFGKDIKSFQKLNPHIKDPNKINVGDKINTKPAAPAAAAAPKPSSSPHGDLSAVKPSIDKDNKSYGDLSGAKAALNKPAPSSSSSSSNATATKSSPPTSGSASTKPNAASFNAKSSSSDVGTPSSIDKFDQKMKAGLSGKPDAGSSTPATKSDSTPDSNTTSFQQQKDIDAVKSSKDPLKGSRYGSSNEEKKSLRNIIERRSLRELSVPLGATGKRKDVSTPMVGIRMASGKIEKHPPGKSGSSGGGGSGGSSGDGGS